MHRKVFALVRTVIVGTLFLSIWTYFIPLWIEGRAAFENPRPLGWIVVGIGALVLLPCLQAFAWRGLGTPAPFDPPRRLVVTGPYRFVRNPMYLGLGLGLIGEAIIYPNITAWMLVLVAVLWMIVSLFVVFYEEPTLRRKFGSDYETYCRHVRRWLPRLRPFDPDARAARR
jgi:protein-S-isoprenylcysteine O-methyltransferase Ste14